MPPNDLQHRRTHNSLLISKLLNQRDTTSPFTLVLDSLEQSGRPLVAEYTRRAKAARIQIILVAFETLHAPRDVHFIKAWEKPAKWSQDVTALCRSDPSQRNLVVVDTLNPLVATSSSDLPAILSGLITPTTSLIATLHTDIPTQISGTRNSPYSPSPITILRYLATTIFTTHSTHHVVAKHAARARSHAEPTFGLDADVEGLLQGKGANGAEGLVLEMEYRRRSGRGVKEWFFMPIDKTVSESVGRESVILLEDHPSFVAMREQVSTKDGGDTEDAGTTFELGLTERQKADREGVVLPYFDAQKGGGEGGRILYDMGSEDDFDEEEDEI